MRKKRNRILYIPPDGRVSDKAMLTRVILTVSIIVACLVAMSVTAYAYFSSESVTNQISLRSAEFKISVQAENTDAPSQELTAITSNQQSYKIEGLQPGTTYAIKITLADGNTAQTGFVVLEAEGCESTYCTQQLGVDAGVSGGRTDELSFTVSVSAETDVMLFAHWGTSSSYDDYNKEDNDEIEENDLYIEQNEEISLTITSGS